MLRRAPLPLPALVAALVALSAAPARAGGRPASGGTASPETTGMPDSKRPKGLAQTGLSSNGDPLNNPLRGFIPPAEYDSPGGTASPAPKGGLPSGGTAPAADGAPAPAGGTLPPGGAATPPAVPAPDLSGAATPAGIAPAVAAAVTAGQAAAARGAGPAAVAAAAEAAASAALGARPLSLDGASRGSLDAAPAAGAGLAPRAAPALGAQPDDDDEPAAADPGYSKAVAEIAAMPEERTLDQRRADRLLAEAGTRLTVGSDPRGALLALDQAVRFDPANIEALTRRSALLRAQGRFEEALADANRAIALDGRSVEARDQAAWALFKLGRYQEAIEAATRALELDPNDAVALAVRARAKWALGDKAGALADARAAARLDARFARLADTMEHGTYADSDELEAGDEAARVGTRAPAVPLASAAALLLLALGGLGWWLVLGRGERARPTAGASASKGEDGRLAGKYELKRVLGRDETGTVHEAFDHSLKRAVAVKTLSEGPAAAGPRSRALLIREAQAVAALHHPHIADIYEVVEDSGGLYLVFELLRGKTLRQVLAEEGALSLDRAEKILEPVCRALELAHARGLAHRDLKPEGIMLVDGGFVKLMDFGIAAAPDGSAAKAAEADVYALGVCLYAMLTAREPRPEIPAAVDALLRRALDPDPSRRMRTPAQFLAELSHAARAGGTPPAAAAAKA